MASEPRILMYHHVAPLKGREGLLPYVVSPETFATQLDTIQRTGLRVMTMAQVVQYSLSEERSPRAVVLSFDDCSQELLEFALPELENRGMKASFYAVSDGIGHTNDWDAHRGHGNVPLMTGDELRSLVDDGHEVGSHGRSHQPLSALPDGEVASELVESRQTIEQFTGHSVVTLAYPFGAIPRNHRHQCMVAGYSAACSIFADTRTVLEDLFAVRRILVHEADVGPRLRFKLSAVYLRLRGIRDRRVGRV